MKAEDVGDVHVLIYGDAYLQESSPLAGVTEVDLEEDGDTFELRIDDVTVHFRIAEDE